MKAKQSASSSDEIAVFQAYTDLINSERVTLWARHNALLLANSLIIGALAISPTVLWENKWAALAMLSAGLLISAAWVRLCALLMSLGTVGLTSDEGPKAILDQTAAMPACETTRARLDRTSLNARLATAGGIDTDVAANRNVHLGQLLTKRADRICPFSATAGRLAFAIRESSAQSSAGSLFSPFFGPYCVSSVRGKAAKASLFSCLGSVSPSPAKLTMSSARAFLVASWPEAHQGRSCRDNTRRGIGCASARQAGLCGF